MELPILEEDSYEKNVVMYLAIGEPRHIAGKKTNTKYYDNRQSSDPLNPNYARQSYPGFSRFIQGRHRLNFSGKKKEMVVLSRSRSISSTISSTYVSFPVNLVLSLSEITAFLCKFLFFSSSFAPTFFFFFPSLKL